MCFHARPDIASALGGDCGAWDGAPLRAVASPPTPSLVPLTAPEGAAADETRPWSVGACGR